MIILLYWLDPLPITLTSEGSFVLTNIKKISVTEDFLGLKEDIRNCQTKELRSDCITERYHQTLLELCDCAPISLIHSFHKDVNKF